MSTVQTPPAVFTSPRSPRFELIRSSRQDHWLIIDNRNARRAVAPAWLLDKAEDYLDKLNAQEQRAQAGKAKPLFPIAPESCRQSEPCWSCQKMITARPDDQSNTCDDCRRSAAEAEANSLRGTLHDLLTGRGIFSVLAVSERREQVEALCGKQLEAEALIELGSIVAQSISDRLHSVPATPPARLAVREMTITELASVEPLYVGGTVTDAERDAAEATVEVDFDRDVPPDEILHCGEPINLAKFAADVCGFNPGRPAA